MKETQMSEDLTNRIWDVEDEKLGSILKDLLHRIGVVNDDLLKTQVELLEVKSRLHTLERRKNLENPQT
jgi:hypothetical protein